MTTTTDDRAADQGAGVMSANLALARALRDEYGAPEQDITDHLKSAERIIHDLAADHGYHIAKVTRKRGEPFLWPGDFDDAAAPPTDPEEG